MPKNDMTGNQFSGTTLYTHNPTSKLKDEYRRKVIGLFNSAIYTKNEAIKYHWTEEELEFVLGALGLTDDDLYKAAHRQASYEEED